MDRRGWKYVFRMIGASLVLTCSAAVGPVDAGDEPKQPPAGDRKPQDHDQKAKVDAAAESRAIERAVDKSFAEYDLKPHPPAAIPDDPPPHEGAMISLTHVVEPPDMVLVELLEGLPGRPISGERMVRGDGKISLGFYGEVEVRGLTIVQVKVKILQQLRKYLSDEVLGLVEFKEEEHEVLPPPPDAGKPGPPARENRPKEEGTKPRKASSNPGVKPSRAGAARLSSTARPRSAEKIRLLARRQDQKAEEPVRPITDEPKKPIRIPLDAGGQITITIEIQARERKEEEFPAVAPGPNSGKPIKPADSERLFVDVTAYNSMLYFVLGDVAAPGRLPWTGNETVLDALQFAGGLLPTAEPKDIRIARPARGGKPAREYKVNLEAIQKGDVTANYQLFPGDRLIVGRNDVVKKTIEMDRLSSAIQDVINSVVQESNMLRQLNAASPEKHDQILRDLVEFWIQEMKRPEGAKLDEQTLREALLKRLQIPHEKK
jgi:protein involved in polysaccharide export with SLBB domain